MKKTLSFVLSLMMILSTLTALPFNAWALETYDISVSVANDEDCGTVSGGATVNEGEEITITATPKTNYRFVYWVNNYGEIVSVNSNYTFTPTYSGTFSAFFEDTASATYSATIADVVFDTENEGYGDIAEKTVSVTNIGTGILPFRCEEATITGTNADAFEIRNYQRTGSVCCFPDDTDNVLYIKPINGLSAGTYTAIVTVNERDNKIAPLTCNVSFTVTADNVISLSALPTTGGMVTGGGTYSNGTSVTVTATENEKFEFTGWYEGGEKVSDNATYTFTAESTRNLVARFEQTKFNISATADPSEGSVTITGSGTYNKGESVTVTAIPNEGYTLDYWVDNYGEVKSNESTYSFTASYDATLTAIFKTHTHTMTAISAKAATCSIAGNNAYYKCSDCGKVFKDVAGTQETTIAAETIPATGNHTSDKGTVTKKATPTATGTKVYKCTVCGQTIKTETIAKTAKYNNTLTVKAKKPTVKYSKLKKKNQTIALKNAITISKAQGTVTYTKSSGNKKITINKKTGKITVKKGLKKGTYKVKIKVKAAGNASYKAATKTVTVTIKVK